MALPPEHVLLKRKREDEGNPEYLCKYSSQHDSYLLFSSANFMFKDIDIRKNGQPSKRAGTNVQCFFKRILTESSPNKPFTPSVLRDQLDSTQTSTPQAAHIRSEDIHPNEMQNHGTPLPEDDKMVQEEEMLVSNLSRRSQIPSSPRKLRGEPRAFYLSRKSSPLLPKLSSPQGVHKSRHRKPKALAVFVETQIAKFTSASFRNTETPRTQIADPEAYRPRKRPNKSKAEATWREANWKQPMSSPASVQASRESERDTLQLAEELQQYSIQEIRRTMEKSQNIDMKASQAAISVVGTTKGLKFQPKPPPIRRLFPNYDLDGLHTESASKTASTQGQEADGDDDGDDDDYVYDTYVRHIQPTAQTVNDGTLQIDSLMEIDVDSYGVLVITEEDSELWQAYGEDDVSDKDWNSEEEDENGVFPCCLIFNVY